MSASPRNEDRKPVTLTTLAGMRALGEPIVMVTAYDHPSAQVAEAAGVDMVLVGDSAAMTVLGYDSTVPVSTEGAAGLCRGGGRARGVDRVLVGDSAAMTVLGYDSTVPVSTEELLMLCRAVRRGLKTPFLVGDLPFGSYAAAARQAIRRR